MTNKKRCGRCRKPKSINEYHKTNSTKDGLQTICKLCRCATASEYSLITSYGIGFEEKKKMYKKQKGLCGLCHKPLAKNYKTAHVDHDHATGKIRDLVHNHCNWVIGQEENHPGLLFSALAYKKKWK